MTLSSLELFSGAGGLAKGLELAGFSHAGFVEFNKHACETLRANFDPAKVFFGDVKDFEFSSVGNVDLIAGGPPCQPFSIGGKHRANQDSRDMFPYAARAIDVLQPSAFLFENVKGLLRPNFSEYFRYILLRLTFPDCQARSGQSWQEHLRQLRNINFSSYTGTKYLVSYQLLNAANYGIPQKRERVFIVGVRSDLHKEWVFPKPSHSGDRLMWDQYVTGNYWERHRLAPPSSTKASELTEAAKNKFGFLAPTSKPWVTIRDSLGDVPEPSSQHDIGDHVFKDGARSYAGHTGSGLDLPAKTIKAGVHGVPGGENMLCFPDGRVRYFTVYEGKMLQTFPSNFKICGAWGEGMRQIGNAVPVKLAHILGEHIHALIDNRKN